MTPYLYIQLEILEYLFGYYKNSGSVARRCILEAQKTSMPMQKSWPVIAEGKNPCSFVESQEYWPEGILPVLQKLIFHLFHFSI